MTIENDFLQFANGGAANVITQSSYAALASTIGQNGFSAGVAQSAQLNKVWRQSATMAAVIAQFIVNQTGQAAIDDGTSATLLANLATAVAVSARQNPVLADTGAANTYVVSNLSAFSAYPTASGLVLDVSISNANTGASTINVDGLGTKPIYGLGLQPLQGGELIVKGVASLLYIVASTVNSGNGAFILMECAGGAQQVAPATQPMHAPQMSQVAGVVGSVRNLAMSVTAASASATLTADEIIVETALGGIRYCLPSFSKTINLATTGAGGMDTGSAPASGFVALYAIYNPTTQTAALLATTITSTAAPSIYAGGSMPAGYTASALVSVWLTNASKQFVIGIQNDRYIGTVFNLVLNTTTATTTPTSFSIASFVPPCAKSVQVQMGVSENSAGSGVQLSVFSSATQIGGLTVQAIVTGQTSSSSLVGSTVLITPQTLFYSTLNTNSVTINIGINGYSI